MGVIEFYDVNYIDDDIIKKLDKAAEKVAKDKLRYIIPYDFLEKILLLYIKNHDYKDINNARVIKPIKKWEIIKIALDFYRSLDDEIYEKVKSVILNQNPKIRANIYKLSEIKCFGQEDFEFKEFKRYSKFPEHYRIANKDMLYMPLGDIKDCESNEQIKENEGTIEDIYKIVHELGHVLDLYLDYIINDDDKIISESYDPGNDLLAESTAIAFERALTKYLLDNKLISIKDAEQVLIQRRNNNINKCYFTYIKLELARKRQENGNICKKDIDKIAENMGFGIGAKNDLVDMIIKKSEEKFLVDARYALSGVLSPTIEKLIYQGETDKIKQYLEESRNGNIEKALLALGITLDDEGLKKLQDNMIKQRFDFEKDVDEGR